MFREPRTTRNKLVGYLYYDPERDSHFLQHDTRSMQNLGMTRTCFIALCVMLVSYVLDKIGSRDYANLQYLLVNIIVNNIDFKNTILYGNSKKLNEGSLREALEYYIKKASIAEAVENVASEENEMAVRATKIVNKSFGIASSYAVSSDEFDEETESFSKIIFTELDRISSHVILTIKSLHYAITGKFSPDSKIITGSSREISMCDDNSVNYPGTFFHEYPLNVPIPIAITTQTTPKVLRSGLHEWGVDDWGSLVISCENEYVVRWYGAYGSDGIQIAFGVSAPMTLRQFYSYIDENGNFDVFNHAFGDFVKQFILRRADYVDEPGKYEKKAENEIKVWIDYATTGQFFKMIAFTTQYGEFIDVIETIILEKGIIDASRHVKFLGKGLKRKSLRKPRVRRKLKRSRRL